MSKIKKIIEARAIVSGGAASILTRLEKTLSKNDLKELENDLKLFKTVFKLLEARIMGLDPKLKERIAKL